jgi:hypothetical protein
MEDENMATAIRKIQKSGDLHTLLSELCSITIALYILKQNGTYTTGGAEWILESRREEIYQIIFECCGLEQHREEG